MNSNNQNQIAGNSAEKARCLNCGTELYEGNFCHICGQPIETGRLSTRTFGLSIVSSLTRINRKFMYTIGMVLIKPWRVISEYINGRRATYTNPVQLLLILAFVSVFVTSVFGGGPGGNIQNLYGDYKFISSDTFTANAINSALKFVFTSITCLYLLLLVPAVPIIKLVHKIARTKNYNFAEYMVGAIYASDFILLMALVFSPLRRICPESFQDGISIVQSVLCFIILCTTVYVSLSSSNKKTLSKIGMTVFYLFVCAMFYLLLLLVGVLVREAHQI